MLCMTDIAQVYSDSKLDLYTYGKIFYSVPLQVQDYNWHLRWAPYWQERQKKGKSMISRKLLKSDTKKTLQVQDYNWHLRWAPYWQKRKKREINDFKKITQV